MSAELVREILGWCVVVSYGVLLVWFLVFMLAHDWLHRLHGRWFQLPADQFDIVHYVMMGIYKIGILLFFLVPYLALLIVLE